MDKHTLINNLTVEELEKLITETVVNAYMQCVKETPITNPTVPVYTGKWLKDCPQDNKFQSWGEYIQGPWVKSEETND